MFMVAAITLKGIVRDRIAQAIVLVSLLFLAIPSVASLSMRQVTELSITLSLSLLSFIMLLLSVFLGATSLWKDMERRYTFSVLSLPVSRSCYLLGRFLGLSFFLVMTAILLGGMACLAIGVSSTLFLSPAGQPIVWWYIVAAIGFSVLQYILLVAVAMLFSSVSTSFFLPVFGTICIYLASSITQQVYDYVHSAVSAKTIGPVLKMMATSVYYLLPNLSGFDLKVNAIYSVAPSGTGLLLTLGYFFTYTLILLGAAMMLFNRREMK